MSTFVTLFGGLLAVGVLYALGGLIRSLPLVLRAVLASVIPLLVYFGSVANRWPGLDVAAMHISVFLAAGFVLYMQSQFRRRSQGRLHWAPRLLIGFFLGLVVLNASLLYIATKGLPEPIARWWLGSEGGVVYSGFSGAVSHSPDAAKAVSSQLSQRYAQQALGWRVTLSGLETGDLLQVRATDRSGLPLTGLDAVVSVQRPGASAPVTQLKLTAITSGEYQGVLPSLAAGRWLVELRLSREGELRFRDTWEHTQP